MDLPADGQPFSYDQLPYSSYPVRLSHPCHLAVLATLFDVGPPPPATARILELGAASGGNLIPLAQDLPGSHCVGIDYSARQVEDGQAMIERLGLRNVELRHLNILDLDESFGQFDYILCHGVFSWVPREVQDRVLEICRRHLVENGVAYVSYNTYPGWHLRGVVRDMMKYHVASFEDPQEKISQARLILEFLVESSASHGEAYRHLLGEEAKTLNRHSDTYLFHEHLEEVNDPQYFHEFAARIKDAGLQYLGESDFAAMVPDNFGEDTAAILKEAPLLRQEQYMDFLRNRMFRATLLCHQERKLNREIHPATLARYHVALDSELKIESGSLTSDEPLVLKGEDEIIQASAAVTKAAILDLHKAWPAGYDFEMLFQTSWQRAAMLNLLNESDLTSEHRGRLTQDLMALYSKGMLRAMDDPPPFTCRIEVMPRATPLARAQAEDGNLIANRRHQIVRVTDLARVLLPVLDGTHDRLAMREPVRAALADGRLEAWENDQQLDELADDKLDPVVHMALEELSRAALLIPAEV